MDALESLANTVSFRIFNLNILVLCIQKKQKNKKLSYMMGCMQTKVDLSREEIALMDALESLKTMKQNVDIQSRNELKVAKQMTSSSELKYVRLYFEIAMESKFRLIAISDCINQLQSILKEINTIEKKEEWVQFRDDTISKFVSQVKDRSCVTIKDKIEKELFDGQQVQLIETKNRQEYEQIFNKNANILLVFGYIHKVDLEIYSKRIPMDIINLIISYSP
eukprot:538771_1